MFNAMTRLNPNGRTYRVYAGTLNTIRVENVGGSTEVSGSIIDRLGEYEALKLEPDEIYNALWAVGRLPKAAIEARRTRNLSY